MCQRIDERSGEIALDGKKKVNKNTNNVLSSCTFRIFRLAQTEVTNGGGNQLGLNGMDFVGKASLFPNSKKKKRCFRKSLLAYVNILIVLLIDSSTSLADKLIKEDDPIKVE